MVKKSGTRIRFNRSTRRPSEPASVQGFLIAARFYYHYFLSSSGFGCSILSFFFFPFFPTANRGAFRLCENLSHLSADLASPRRVF